MPSLKRIVLISSAVSAIVSGAGSAALAADTITAQQCSALKGMEIPAQAIGLKTGGAVVTLSEMVGVSGPITDPKLDEDGELRQALNPRCLVEGEIKSLSEGAPPIRFAVNLPEKWNRKSLQSGGGGLGGSIITAPGRKASGRIDPIPLDKPYPINLGYATYGSDGGHNTETLSNGVPRYPDNGSAKNAWIRNDEALRNWAGDSLKKTNDVAQVIIEKAYGEKPSRRYFTGESAGAREAMWVAQRYPADYDGIIATSAVLAWTYIHIADNNIRSHLIRGWLDEKAIKLIADQTRNTCDAQDGLKDGVVARYLECTNNAAQLRCKDGNEGEGCLSEAQIASINAIRNPWSMPVELAFGQTRYAGFGVTGNEDGPRYAYSFYTIGKERPSNPLPAGQLFEKGRGAVLNFSNTWVREVIAQDSAFDLYNFDPFPYRKRIQYISSLFDAMDPNLEPFRAKGGKIILYQPSADNALGTPMVAEYYRSVVKTLGKANADQVIRYFVGPGGGHNATGMSQFDTLSMLEQWVEEGKNPPDHVAAVDLDPSTMKRGRELLACVYPKYSKYNGSGDINSAASFTCEDRPDPLAFAVDKP